jgi:hypothetical protein
MGQSERRAAACRIIILEPLPGERRKTNLPMLCFRNWRSKWWRVQCVGEAKACEAGECRHVAHVCEHFAIKTASGTIQRFRPDVRTA